MPSTSAQIQISTSIRLAQSDILTLNSVPIIIAPASTGFINVFEKATATYIYKNAPFTNVSNLIGFYLIPTQPDTTGGTIPSPFLVSNSFGGQSVIGAAQGTSSSFVAANPYPGQMSKLSLSNAALVFMIGQGISGADPLGGDSGSMLTLSVVYSVLAQ